MWSVMSNDVYKYLITDLKSVIYSVKYLNN